MGRKRDQIIGSADLKRETVEVPEWGTTIVLRELDGAERVVYGDTLDGLDAKGKARPLWIAAHLLVLSAMEDDGRTPVFSVEDVPELVRKNPKVLARLFDHAAALSTVGEKEVAAAAGKSDGAPSGASSGD